MKKFVRPLLFVFVAMSLLLAACGAPAATEAPVPAATASQNNVIVVPLKNPSFNANAEGKLDGWQTGEHVFPFFSK